MLKQTLVLLSLALSLLCCGRYEVDVDSYDRTCSASDECARAALGTQTCRLFPISRNDMERYLEDYEELNRPSVICEFSDGVRAGCYEGECILAEIDCSDEDLLNMQCPSRDTPE